MPITIFDLDNTLIDCDSDYEWGQFLVAKKLVDEKEYSEANHYFFEAYKNGTLDVIEYSAFSFKPLSVRSMEELAILHKEFMQTVIIPHIKPQSQGLIEKHRKKQDTLMIVTATNSFITRPIADFFKIQHLLAIEPKIVDGRYTTEVDGVPTFKEGKVTRLKQWLVENNQTLEGSTCYTDSHTDISLLNIIEHPIAVDPDTALKEIATDKHWPIISLK